ncbi:MAG: NUDIX hydrolase [Chloroflexi bacterium]|nr:NUDIX hydrolase [Chloroflexota bacterium]
MLKFELSASLVLFRGPEILVMKRGAGSFSAGGWFLPGGHLEEGERPAEACARELFEETGIAVDPGAIALVDVMSYEHDGAMAHILIYRGECAPITEPEINDEHVAARWMTPEGYVARFLDPAMLRERGIPAAGVALAEEVARVVRSAAAAR